MAWGKAGSDTLTSASSSMDSGTMTASKTNQILIHWDNSGSISSSDFRLNDVSSNSYAHRNSTDGGADSTSVSQNGIDLHRNDIPAFSVLYMVDISGEEKLLIESNIHATTGAGNAPSRVELVGKYAVTTSRITQLTDTANSNNWAVGSNLSVLGSDITPAAAVPAIDNIQDNSLFIEKENARRYWFDAESDITPTDLNTPTWTKSTSDLSQTTDYLQWANMTGGTENGYYDIGSGSVSDTKWVLRAKLTVSSYSTGTAAHSRWCSLGLSSTSSTMTGTQDSINIILRTNTSSDTIAGTRSNGTGLDGQLGTAGISGVTLGNGTFYLEMIRESGSDYKLYIRSGSHTGTLLGTGSYTDASGVTGLQYIKTGRLYSSVANGNFVAKWEDIEFYNNTTSTITPATWTMKPTYEEDFSSYADQSSADAVWVSNDTGDFRVNITNDNLDYDSKVTGTTNQGIYYDFGTALSDTAWVLDFKMVISTLTLYSGGSVGAATYITMNNSGTGGAIGGSVDAIGFYMSSTATGGRFTMTNADSSPLNIAGGTLTTINATGTYYVRIIRLSSTSMRLELYSDSARENLIEGQTKTGISSGITGLKYFRLQDNQSSAGTGTGQNVGTIDDIKIYNGVTTPN